MFTYSSVQSALPAVGDEGEIYADGDIQWVRVERVTNFRIDLTTTDFSGKRYSFDHDTFISAVGDV